MRNVLIEEGALDGEAAFHGLVKSALGFPEWYGGNFAALADCLGDVDEPTRLVLAGAGASGAPASPWFARAVRVAERAARENPALEVVSGAAAREFARRSR